MKRETHTILLIEDDPHDQLLIEHAFRANGVLDRLQAVSNGREGIAYLAGEGQYADRERFEFPSFVLTDLKMPVADGFAVLEAMKENPHWSIIPVAVLSASTDEDDIKKAYMLGASSYLAKPSNLQELGELLRKFHEYWTMCEVPRIDATGVQLPTSGLRKLGQRFPQDAQDPLYNRAVGEA